MIDPAKPNILLVNDSEFMITSVQFFLRPHFNVYVAEDGVQACELFLSQAKDFFKVVVLDMNMPRMGGIEAATHM